MQNYHLNILSKPTDFSDSLIMRKEIMKTSKVVFLVLFQCLIFNISAHALAIKISPAVFNPISSGIPAQISQTFDVNVMIEDVFDLGEFRFDIIYDPEIVTAKSIVMGDFLTNSGRIFTETLSEIDNNIGRLSYGVSSTGSNSGPSGSGSLAAITFDVISLSGGILQFDNAEVRNTNGDAFSPVSWDGEFLPKYHITTSYNTGGTISPAGEILVAPDSEQYFGIQPSPHYHIKDVLINGVSIGKTDGQRFQHVTGNYTIQAVFEIDSFVITATAGNGGTIQPSGEVKVVYGENQTFKINPSDGYRILNLMIDDQPVNKTTEYTFQSVTKNFKISVTFFKMGDINKNESVDLEDAILALRLLCGIEITDQTIWIDADVNGDGKIGIEEVVYILQKVAEIR